MLLSKLGASIPSMNPHALSVSLPTWEDNIGWASGDRHTVEKMDTGYPRFFVHKLIQQLASILLERFGTIGELCMLFPTKSIAEECVLFLQQHSPSQLHRRVSPKDIENRHLTLHCVLFPSENWSTAKAFWQNTGMGISSRYAEACISAISSDDDSALLHHHARQKLADTAKLRLKARIATLAVRGEEVPECHIPNLGRQTISQNDVWLYPSGMSAIWHAHQLTMTWKPGYKSVCFGFPYTDTLKILQKWGPGCYFYGHDPDANLAAFEEFLISANNPQTISALYCECPSNPLLQSSDLVRLRQLANDYGFLIIVDDTVGSSVNIDLTNYADIIATSLSKLFSGNADVMGGSLILNPASQHYDILKSIMKATYVDDYFAPDAIQMELNSRNFSSRVNTINKNTREVCHFLRSRSRSFAEASGMPASELSRLVIQDVFYPEWVTRRNFDMVRRAGKDDNFGPLFSITFISHTAAETFFDNLPCAKGPSLGTNFTLACPYTILAHFKELDWAEQYGVGEDIVRVSVGMETRETLLKWFRRSVDFAESENSGQ